MPTSLLALGASLLVSACGAAALLLVSDEEGLVRKYFERYTSWWTKKTARCFLDKSYNRVPACQLAALVFIVVVYVVTLEPAVLGFAAGVVVIAPLLLVRYQKVHDASLEAGLDAFLTALADSLTTVPNLSGALESLIPNIEQPMKSEVKAVLAEVKLGRSVDEALVNLARRLALPGLDAAVGAALLGKRTGGDLPVILRKIAATGREMARLEGVVKTKTAEGRSQAWVMGSVPPALILILEWVNPQWLAPVWSDPIGWILLGGGAVLEVIAIVLIRKIMAVEI